MSIPTKNNRYQNSDSSSIFNVKQNLNAYLADFADIDFSNVIDNYRIYSGTISGNEFTKDWTKYGDFGGMYIKDHLNTNLVSGGYLIQEIGTKLKPFTNYTLIVYGSASVTGAIKCSIVSPIANQITCLETPFGVGEVSFTLASTSGGTNQKHITTFKFNSAPVSAAVYVKIENVSSQNVNFNIYDTLCYSSLIELGNLPPHKNLPVQPNIIPGAVYIDTVYDETGVAINGTPLINSGYLQDFYTNRKYNFVALNNDFYLHELNYDETREPANPLGIKVTNDENNATYYLRVVNKNLELEQISYVPTSNPAITDFENGCVYSLHVSAGELKLVQNSFSPSDTVYQDVVNNQKYIMIVEDGALKIVETDSSCIVNVATSATFKTMKDLYNGKRYSLVVSGGTLQTVETTGTGDCKAFYHVKDYKNNLDYNLVIENGVVAIVESYNLSLDEMFLRLNAQDDKFSELYNSDTTLISTVNNLSNTISNLTNTNVTLQHEIDTLTIISNSSVTGINLLNNELINVTTDVGALQTFIDGFTSGFVNVALSGAGYQKLSGGIIIQWGSYVVGDGTTDKAVIFPVTFPNRCITVTTSRFGVNPQALIPNVYSKSNSYFILQTSEWAGGVSGADTAVEWIAIGN